MPCYCTECGFFFANQDSYWEHTYGRRHRKNLQRMFENAESPAPPSAADTGFVIHVGVTLRLLTWGTEYIIMNTDGTRLVVQRSRL